MIADDSAGRLVNGEWGRATLQEAHQVVSESIDVLEMVMMCIGMREQVPLTEEVLLQMKAAAEKVLDTGYKSRDNIYHLRYLLDQLIIEVLPDGTRRIS